MTLEPKNLLELQLAIEDILPSLYGWQNKPGRPYQMANLIVETKPKVVVEIGVFGGQTLIPQALALKYNGKGRIYGIDPYDMVTVLKGLDEDEPADWWKTQDLNEIRRQVFASVESLKLPAGIWLQDSKYCDIMEQIDILHIDGGHNEEASCSDVDLYATKVKPGGFIWFDDSHFKGTQKALRQLETFCTLKTDFKTYRLYEHN